YDLAELYSTATGLEIDAHAIMLAGKRIITMERVYNGILGHTRENDLLPYRLMHETQKDALHKGAINSKEKLDYMKDEYFRLHNWDLKKGLPTKQALEDLGLEELIPRLFNYIEQA
ncbi:MAG TPA: aldehyde ferredoxin oxidoreductase C-terminal domain-containing protein, partial [Clostridia bacterium]|nr:aldehyde ferredoxin oxidoreductase C-terminal domain-containing protein [Clostridia bacterium]